MWIGRHILPFFYLWVDRWLTCIETKYPLPDQQQQTTTHVLRCAAAFKLAASNGRILFSGDPVLDMPSLDIRHTLNTPVIRASY
jgi:hypothetical protein